MRLRPHSFSCYLRSVVVEISLQSERYVAGIVVGKGSILAFDPTVILIHDTEH
jgi:hypothetical protein